MNSQKEHWEHIYEVKSPEEVSWTQSKPTISIQLLEQLQPDFSAPIIDVGGGDSRFVDYLIDAGFTNVTVLDISQKAIDKAKARLGEKAESVEWICSDINDFYPPQAYAFWHDRACFHFLTTQKEVEHYVSMVERFVYGGLIIGTFSETGPLKCSGLEIKQYSEVDLIKLFNEQFEVVAQMQHVHITPFKTEQNFTFCSFLRKTEFD